MNRRWGASLLLIAGALGLVGCGGPTATAAGAPTATAAPLAEACALVPRIRAAYDDLTLGVAAIKAGDEATTTASGSSVLEQTREIQSRIVKLGPAVSGEDLLRDFVIGVNADIGTMAGLLADPSATIEEKATTVDSAAQMGQAVGFIEAYAKDGRGGIPGPCPGLTPKVTTSP